MSTPATTAPAAAAAAARARRLVGVDAARGVALLGMMAVHVLPAEDSDGSPSAAYLVASGRSAALFAVLAGVGLALAYGRRARERGTAAALAVRAGLIAGIGLLLGGLGSGVAVILAYYGVLFLLAIPLLRLGVRALAATAAIAAVAVPVVSQLLRPELPQRRVDNPTLRTLLDDPLRLLGELTITGYYPALAWTGYLCAGWQWAGWRCARPGSPPPCWPAGSRSRLPPSR